MLKEAHMYILPAHNAEVRRTRNRETNEWRKIRLIKGNTGNWTRVLDA